MAAKPRPKHKPPASRAERKAGVSYRLLRERAVRQAKSDPLFRAESCDAHPMLLRAASSIGEPAGRRCAFCGDVELVLVKYAFGGNLPREGMLLELPSDHARLAQRVGVFTCRVVEVCCQCHWNFMVSSYTIVGRSQAARS